MSQADQVWKSILVQFFIPLDSFSCMSIAAKILILEVYASVCMQHPSKLPIHVHGLSLITCNTATSVPRILLCQPNIAIRVPTFSGWRRPPRIRHNQCIIVAAAGPQAYSHLSFVSVGFPHMLNVIPIMLLSTLKQTYN